ncbi:unnamed protein product [Danaus chrysippus]|uniref:(African queen) hypothetical protein n=1 Tax=Danaus chrysippus TaxID=151541 RepID=A0A8J2VSR7_9NEOP|nr:unnamed protein product [Danaus chrysippus]
MMYINCTTTYLCGGSFINNRVVLTAAHCLYPCVDPANDILILNYGHAAIDKMKHLKVRRFLVHYKYSDISLENDIGLIYSNAPVKFGKSVKRVALLSIFPRRATHGYVTGWGLVNRDPEELATSMKYVHQDIIRPRECRRGNVPAGIFCGQSKNVEEYPEM